MEPTHLEHLVIFLTNLGDATCDFGEVAKQRGVTRKNNALRDFKAMMKKYGVDYNGKSFTSTTSGSSDDQLAPTTPATKKSSTPRKRKTKDEDNADCDEDKTSPKKSPAKKPKKDAIETEDDASDVKIDSFDED